MQYTGSVAPDDILHIFLQDEIGENVASPPFLQLEEEEPTFPYSYTFEGVPTGTYWIAAQLDVGGDNPNPPAQEDDAFGFVGPVFLSPGGAVTAASFSMTLN